MKKRMMIGMGLIALGTLGWADNIFQENTPPDGPYKIESDFNWSSKSLMDPGNWFITGSAKMDGSSGSLAIDPPNEKGGFFMGRQGADGTLTMSGGELKILSSVHMGHNGGKGILNLSGGTLFVEGNLAQPGKAIRVSGGTLQVGNTINSQVDEFSYTGGKIQCGHFRIDSGVVNFQIGPNTSTVDVKRGLSGSGVLTLSVADGYELPTGQEIVLFTCSSNEKMDWTDGQEGQWQDGETVRFGGKEFKVIRKKNRLGVVLQSSQVLG